MLRIKSYRLESMTLKTFLQGNWLQRIALLVWIVSSVVVMFSMRMIDAIVNGTLYSYGLQFNIVWAQPYWNYSHIFYACQFVSIALSVVALFFSFLNKNSGPKPEQKIDKPAPKYEQNAEQNVNTSVPQQQNVNTSVPQKGKTTENGILISCPNCKKSFGKPLAMLDFSHGKAKLVNVCPYCNTILGSANWIPAAE
jgi:uncharacterized Zn-finger protein